MTNRLRRARDSMHTRFSMAFAAVAFSSVAILSGLSYYSARGDVATLTHQEQVRRAVTTADVVADAYREAGNWTKADLSTVSELAADYQATLNVIDDRGQEIPVPRPTKAQPPESPVGPVRSHAVIVNGEKVGLVVLHFYHDLPQAAESQLRKAILDTISAGTAIAVVVALLVSIAVSRSLTRPLRTLIKAVRAMGAGDRSVRVEPAGSFAGGELLELAVAFDSMADTIAKEDELRRSMATDIAHELRTPLAILQAGTESLADGSMEATPEALSSMNDEVVRLGRTVQDLEVLSSAEAATLGAMVKFMPVSPIVEHTVDTFRTRFEIKGVGLESRIQPISACVDSHRLDQILTNLLSNALKFTPVKGEVRVTLASDSSGPFLEVEDNGEGIPADELPHVFERFWRGRASRGKPGSGVGLAVVRSLVEALGGSVEITSEAGLGTRARVSLAGEGFRS